MKKVDKNINTKLYMRETTKLLKFFTNNDDYKNAFFILTNALKNTKKDEFDYLVETYQEGINALSQNYEKN